MAAFLFLYGVVTMDGENGRLYSAHEVCERLNFSRATLSRLLKSGVIGCFRVGRRTIFAQRHLDAFLAAVEHPPRTEEEKKAKAEAA